MPDEEYLQTKIKELFMTIEQFERELKELRLKQESLERLNNGMLTECKNQNEVLLKNTERTVREIVSSSVKALEERIEKTLEERKPITEEDLINQKQVNDRVFEIMKVFDDKIHHLYDDVEKTNDLISKRILHLAMILGKKNLLTSRELAIIIPSVTRNEKKFLRRKMGFKV